MQLFRSERVRIRLLSAGNFFPRELDRLISQAKAMCSRDGKNNPAIKEMTEDGHMMFRATFSFFIFLAFDECSRGWLTDIRDSLAGPAQLAHIVKYSRVPGATVQHLLLSFDRAHTPCDPVFLRFIPELFDSCWTLVYHNLRPSDDALSRTKLRLAIPLAFQPSGGYETFEIHYQSRSSLEDDRQPRNQPSPAPLRPAATKLKRHIKEALREYAYSPTTNFYLHDICRNDRILVYYGQDVRNVAWLGDAVFYPAVNRLIRSCCPDWEEELVSCVKELLYSNEGQAFLAHGSRYAIKSRQSSNQDLTEHRLATCVEFVLGTAIQQRRLRNIRDFYDEFDETFEPILHHLKSAYDEFCLDNGPSSHHKHILDDDDREYTPEVQRSKRNFIPPGERSKTGHQPAKSVQAADAHLEESKKIVDEIFAGRRAPLANVTNSREV